MKLADGDFIGWQTYEWPQLLPAVALVPFQTCGRSNKALVLPGSCEQRAKSAASCVPDRFLGEGIM